MVDTKSEPTQVMIVDDEDWFLQFLVNLANSGATFGITLNVGGFLISGYLIGGQAYFKDFGEEFSVFFQDEEATKDIKNIIVKNGELYTSEDDVPPPSYIHLQDAHFFNTNGNPVPNNRGVWWRGRLSEVDGFSLGVLSASRS